MFNIKFISCAEIWFEVEKVLSENILYRPFNRGKYTSLILSSKARMYKDHLKVCCEESDFHDHVSNILQSHGSVVIKSYYNFLLPLHLFFTKTGDITKCDVTNMVKPVEDSVIGCIIDDRYVIENVVKKTPILGEKSFIVIDFEFYQFSPAEVSDNLITLLT